MDTIVYDAVLGPLCGIIFVVYNFYFLICQARKESRHTAHGAYIQHRKNFIAATMQGHKDILAIQTLRNMIMASNLMATTCMVIIGLLINNLTNENSDFLGILSYNTNHRMYSIKTLVACILFIFSFLNHSLAIRYLVHLGFIMGDTIDRSAEKFAVLHLQKGCRHFMFGQRFFYFALTSILWLFDIEDMVIGLIIVIFILWKLDSNDGLDKIEDVNFV